jgi:hypothetical protein
VPDKYKILNFGNKFQIALEENKNLQVFFIDLAQTTLECQAFWVAYPKFGNFG